MTTSKRSNALPEIPTIAESGVEGYDVSGWYGILGPAGLPPDILGRLNGAMNHAVRQADVVKQLAQEGIDAVGSTPD